MKRTKTLLNLFAIYLLVAVPFKVMEIIPGFTDIRPVVLLGPIYGIFFGITGCGVMAVGNLIMDIVSDSLRWSSIAGFIANFLGPWCFWFYWTRASREPFSLRTGKSVLRHCGVIVFSAFLEGMIITPAVILIYPNVNSNLFALTLLANNVLFPVFFGIPLLILMQEELGFAPVWRGSLVNRETASPGGEEVSESVRSAEKEQF